MTPRPVDPCPDAQRECPECDGKLITVVPRGDYQVAVPCTCRAPCPVCAGVGFLEARDEKGYRTVRPCARTEANNRIEMFNAARLPARFHRARFETFNPGRNVSLKAGREQLFRAVANFEPGDPGFLLYGGCGTGKTHLLIASLHYLLIRRGIPARFVEFFHLLSELRAQFDGRGDTTAIIRPLIEIPVLAIDELGKGRSRRVQRKGGPVGVDDAADIDDWPLQVLDELVTKRYNAKRTTLFTSNYYPDGTKGDVPRLADRVGERIYSRLVEMCLPLHLNGPDYRAKLSAG